MKQKVDGILSIDSNKSMVHLSISTRFLFLLSSPFSKLLPLLNRKFRKELIISHFSVSVEFSFYTLKRHGSKHKAHHTANKLKRGDNSYLLSLSRERNENVHSRKVADRMLQIFLMITLLYC